MASGFTSTGLNYPLLSIPAYYVVSLVPHMYAMNILGANGYKPNNANPRASLAPANVQGKVPEDVFKRYQRAENAQSNNHEQMPLFAAAVLASLFAERIATPAIKIGGTSDIDPTGLATYIGLFFAVRAAYNVAYITIADHSKSFIRSGLWSVGAGLSIYQLFKVAQVLG
ncbi:hypothetical protein BU23DRAFT_562309 [Bimuria novae-zelandiae CBS 107.79]|uniref:Membrane-associated proteins in eicosanoid and glutathione metabolism n=1 Tax=Bimuria novae-zelandiae CBS 107.79 TaxID=1447943 RepID=A0A6A5USE9_9PLEO|nr:hypothetical protein BU23DRAFT_562309 [Bimuria novae-zelandiae CBS 107.79]